MEQGQRVRRGDKLAVVDFEGVRADGYDDTIMVVVTNTQDYLDVVPSVGNADTLDRACMNVVL